VTSDGASDATAVLTMELERGVVGDAATLVELRDAATARGTLAAAGRATGTASEKDIADAAKALDGKLTAIEETLYQTKNRAPQDPLNYPIRLNNKLAALAGTVASAEAAPTAQARAVYAELKGKIDAQLVALTTVLADDVAGFNRLVREREVPAVMVREK